MKNLIYKIITKTNQWISYMNVYMCDLLVDILDYRPGLSDMYTFGQFRIDRGLKRYLNISQIPLKP